MSKKPPVTSRGQVERGTVEHPVETTVEFLERLQAFLESSGRKLEIESVMSVTPDDWEECERTLAYAERIGCMHVCSCGGHKRYYPDDLSDIPL